MSIATKPTPPGAPVDRPLSVSDTDADRWTPLTDEERRQFHEEGYVVVRNAIDEDRRLAVEAIIDDFYEQEKAAGNLWKGDWMHLQGGVIRHPEFARLLDDNRAFRWIWGLLGWNIYSHHNHLDVNPPLDETGEPERWGWHQDGWRQNSDAEYMGEYYGYDVSRPQFSIKTAFVFSDLSETDRGSTLIIPGSHLDNTLPRPDDPEDFEHPEGTIQVTGNPGDALVFDRRMWHSRSRNFSDITRKIFFLGYTYRWIRPLDPMPLEYAEPFWDELTDVQKQLLGDGPNLPDYWGIHEAGGINDAIPLRAELKERGLLDRSVPWLR